MHLNSKRIELVMPSRPVLIRDFWLRPRKRLINIYRNTLPVLAALTPSDFLVTATDESVERVRIKKNIDILGISLSTAFAPRGYAIADQYRRAYNRAGRELAIVFGGTHATALPEEALEHGDSVVLGEAECSWQSLLCDYSEGNLKSMYPRSGESTIADESCVPIPRRELVHRKSLITIEALQLSRGCPRACEFCSIGSGTKVRRIPIDRVEEEIAQMRGRYVALLDDNFFGNPSRDSEYIASVLGLFRKHSMRWVSQMPLYAAADTNLVREMIVSGCKGVYIGIDSVEDTLSGKLSKNRVADPIATLLTLKRLGLYVMSGFVFGFDSETPSVFQDTIRFAQRARLNLASFHILTPYPGTKLYDRLKSEGRITRDREWELFDTAHVVFQPMNMSASELYCGFRRAVSQFYSVGSILSRNYRQDPLHLLANALYWLGLHPTRLSPPSPST